MFPAIIDKLARFGSDKNIVLKLLSLLSARSAKATGSSLSKKPLLFLTVNHHFSFALE
jgi:hypothetical protein